MMAAVFPQQPAPDMNAEVLMLLREIRDDNRALLGEVMRCESCSFLGLESEPSATAIDPHWRGCCRPSRRR